MSCRRIVPRLVPSSSWSDRMDQFFRDQLHRALSFYFLDEPYYSAKRKRLGPTLNTEDIADDTGTFNEDFRLKNTNDEFRLELPCKYFLPEELQVTLCSPGILKITGKHEEHNPHNANCLTVRSFVQKYVLPEGIIDDEIQSTLDERGRLTITAPKRKMDLDSAGTPKLIPITTVTKANNDEPLIAAKPQKDRQVVQEK